MSRSARMTQKRPAEPGSPHRGTAQDAAAAGELDLAAAGAALVSAFSDFFSVFVSVDVEPEPSEPEPDSAFATALPDPERLSVR